MYTTVFAAGFLLVTTAVTIAVRWVNPREEAHTPAALRSEGSG